MLSAKDFHELVRTRKKKPPSVIFKYCTIETATKILGRKKLRFQSPLRFNDPFDSQWDPLWSVHNDEARKYLRTLLEKTLREPEYTWPSEISFKHLKALRGDTQKLKSMSVDGQKRFLENMSVQLSDNAKLSEAIFVARQEDLRSRARVCCFCKQANSVLMWSHYAQEHGGVVLGFSTESLESHFKRPVEPVKYCSDFPLLIDVKTWAESAVFGWPLPDITKNDPRIWALLKADAWSYEREWRFAWIAPRGTSGYLIDHDFPGTTLIEVVFGCKTKQEDVAAVRGLAISLNNEVEFSRMETHPARFELARSRLAAPTKSREASA